MQLGPDLASNIGTCGIKCNIAFLSYSGGCYHYMGLPQVLVVHAHFFFLEIVQNHNGI